MTLELVNEALRGMGGGDWQAHNAKGKNEWIVGTLTPMPEIRAWGEEILGASRKGLSARAHARTTGSPIAGQSPRRGHIGVCAREECAPRAKLPSGSR